MNKQKRDLFWANYGYLFERGFCALILVMLLALFWILWRIFE